MLDLCTRNHKCLEGGEEKKGRSPNATLNLVSGVVTISMLGDGVTRHPCGGLVAACNCAWSIGESTKLREGGQSCVLSAHHPALAPSSLADIGKLD